MQQPKECNLECNNPKECTQECISPKGCNLECNSLKECTQEFSNLKECGLECHHSRECLEHWVPECSPLLAQVCNSLHGPQLQECSLNQWQACILDSKDSKLQGCKDR